MQHIRSMTPVAQAVGNRIREHLVVLDDRYPHFHISQASRKVAPP